MIKLPNPILYILFFISISLSISYFLEAIDKIQSYILIYKLIALAISNVGLSFLFFNNLITEFEKRNSHNKFEDLILKKLMPLSCFIIIVCYLGYLNFVTINKGFSTGKNLFYQLFSYLLSIGIIVIMIVEFKKKKIFVNSN